MKQCTISREVSISGIGVHSGQKVNLHLLPAKENTGIIFRRIDLTPNLEIPAREEYVVDTRSCTCIGKDNVSIATIEHLMAAFSGCAIDNAYVDIDAAELPILDGSAAPFVNLIKQAGVEKQNAPRKYIRVKREILVKDQDKFVKLIPADMFKLSCEIAYDHPCFNSDNQRIVLDFSEETFIHRIAPARTFGFYADYEFHKKNNLARGASLDNTVVFDDNDVMNAGGLRFPDEMVKHKLLDVIGDLYVSGYPILGAFTGYKSGHSLNHQLVRQLFQDKDAWEPVC